MVARHTTTGSLARRQDLAAMVTAVSVIPQASLERVFPVQGQITKASTSLLGPHGSTWGMVWAASLPHSPSTRATQSLARPKRVSVA